MADNASPEMQAHAVRGEGAPSEFDVLFERTPSPMLVAAEDGCLLRANRECQMLSGFSAGELRDKSLVSLAHFDDRETLELAILELNAERGGGTVQFRLLCKDGGYKWTEWTGTRVPERQALYLIGKDVSAACAAMERLTERAKQQELVAELGRSALGSADLASLMSDTVTLLARTLEAEHAEIRELQTDARQFILKAGYGWKELPISQIPVSADPDTVSGYMLSHDQPVIFEDLLCETRFHGSPLLREHGVISGVGCVIPGPQQPYGILAAYSDRPRVFTGDDVHFLRAVANILAAAIDRRRRDQEREQLFDHALTPMLIIGFDGGVKYANPAATAVSGYSRDELQARPFISFAHPDDVPRVENVIPELMGGKPIEAFEIRVHCKDNSYKWIAFDCNVAPDGETFYAIAHDVTDRHQAEDELRRFFDNSPDLLAICGFDGSIKRYNPACLALSGFAPEDLDRMHFLDTVYPDDRDMGAAEIRKLLAGGTLSAFEIRGRKKDGSYHWISWNITAFPDGREFYITGHVVTDRRLAEESLAQRASQQQAVAELGAQALAGADLTELMNEAATVLAQTLGVEFAEVLELL
ncbi:MAG TPA: PAS domain S-box protein, partial [Pirellulales bacterium]|nr:PAS domain S-box protein [Pirellulales bacterium]